MGENNGKGCGCCGGGIVVDSDSASEYAEARLKAESFFATLERCGSR